MDTQPNIPVAQPAVANFVPTFSFPTAGKIFDQAKEIYKTKFQSLILISLCSVGFSGISGFALGKSMTYFKSTAGANEITGVALAAIVGIIIACISVWAFAATIRNITSSDPNISAGKSFNEASKDIMPLIFTGLLAFIFIFGGFLLLIVPGIIFAFWYGQSAYVVITEGLSGKKALDQSKLYAKGNIGQIFKKGFYIGIISILIGFAVGIIFGSIDKLLNLTFMTLVGNIIFQLFWTPLASVYAFLLFQYLRQSKTASAPAQ